MRIAEVAGKSCNMCGQGSYVVKQVEEAVTVNGQTQRVLVTVAECDRCGERAYDDDAVRKLQEAHRQLTAVKQP